MEGGGHVHVYVVSLELPDRYGLSEPSFDFRTRRYAPPLLRVARLSRRRSGQWFRMDGLVEKKDRTQCELRIAPLRPYVFRSVQLSLEKVCGASVSRLDRTFCDVNVSIDDLEIWQTPIV
jgi:hypothetical protein